MLTIEDAQLPGLADLSDERLRAITGADEVELLRLRYRPGKRAILHVETRTASTRNEGALWFFCGEKSQRVARRNKTLSQYDPDSSALFEAFPQDHRMPQIRLFLQNHEAIIAQMTGSPASATPVLLRYRPGLSCTFRCALNGQAPAFVKLVGDDDPVRLLAANSAMQSEFAMSRLSVAPVLGIDPKLGAIAYGSAPGVPLDTALLQGGRLAPLEQSILALTQFWDSRINPIRTVGPAELLSRARESADVVSVTAPSCLSDVMAVVRGLEATQPAGPLRPIHGDMKLEHVFVDADRTTLIDTESVALGLADYDLAQLFGRIWQAELEGHLPASLAHAASALLRDAAGESFDWCLGIVAVRLAKYHAQRPGPDTGHAIRAILARLL
jgi:hypothetical protein